MKIDYSTKFSKFTVVCPFHSNDLVMSLTSYSWSKANHLWYVPRVRANIVRLKELAVLPGVTVTPEAKERIAESDRQTASRMVGAHVGFPSWYKFKREPRKHQVTALDKAYGLKSFALFMDMQTGKSKTTVDLTAAHCMEGHLIGGIVFTKLTLRLNWVGHYTKDCPIPFDIFLPDTDKPKLFAQWLRKKHGFKVMVVGWESLSQGNMIKFCREFMQSLGNRSFVAGDETSYIANMDSGRTEKAIEIAHMADFRYALTGTPAMEGPLNLFSQFEYLDPEVIGIGDFRAYRNRYAVMGGYQREVYAGGPKVATQVIGYKNLDELAAMIAPYTFQVAKKDIYDLPPKRPMLITTKLSKEQQALYDLVLSKQVLRVEGSPEHVMKTVLEVSLRLHQIAGGYTVKPRQEIRKKKDGTEYVKMFYDVIEVVPPERNQKMVELRNVLSDRHKKQQGLIWAAYKPELEAICAIAKGLGMTYGELHGGIPERERQPMVDEYERGGLDLIIGNASTGGMGYTMQASEYNIFYSNTYKAIDRVQAEDRSYGDGQTKSGVWIDIVAEKTVDVPVLRALHNKMDVAEYIRTKINDAAALQAMMRGDGIEQMIKEFKDE